MPEKRSLATVAAKAAAKIAVVMGLALGSQAQAQSMSGEDIIDALRGGGYVLVMNHAEAEEPEAGGGGGRGRGGFGGGRGGFGGGGPRLTSFGEGSVIGMRFALREFDIELGVRHAGTAAPASSTAQTLEFGELQTHEELDEEAAEANAAWLRELASQAPAEGMNNVIVTQAVNITSAFGDTASGLAPGEALLVGTDGQVLGRIEIEEWSRLAIS